MIRRSSWRYQRFSLGSGMRCFRLGSAASLVCRTATRRAHTAAILSTRCACVRGGRETAVTHSLTRIGRAYTRTHKFTYTSIHIFGGPALLSCLFALLQELKHVMLWHLNTVPRANWWCLSDNVIKSGTYQQDRYQQRPLINMGW